MIQGNQLQAIKVEFDIWSRIEQKILILPVILTLLTGTIGQSITCPFEHFR